MVFSRLNRAGVELVPSQNTSLQFGGRIESCWSFGCIEAVTAIIGNARKNCNRWQMLPVFIGYRSWVGYWVLFRYKFQVSRVALKLGLAGGPLVVALILARIVVLENFIGLCHRVPT